MNRKTKEDKNKDNLIYYTEKVNRTALTTQLYLQLRLREALEKQKVEYNKILNNIKTKSTY
jgi:hypothetical protein